MLTFPLTEPVRCFRCQGWIMPRGRAGIAPFWRAREPLLNTAGKGQRNSNGKRQRNPTTGKLRRNTASNTICCCNQGQQFESCLTNVPIHCAKLTIASAVNCTNNSARETTGSINGEYLIPVCGLLALNQCYMLRSFCDRSRYATLGGAGWLLASVVRIEISVTRVTSTTINTFTSVAMQAFRQGCTNAFPSGTNDVNCALHGDNTPPGPGGQKYCQCVSEPATYNGLTAEPKTTGLPSLTGRSKNWTGGALPTTDTWAGFTNTCGPSDNNMHSFSGNYTLEFQYAGTGEVCPDAMEDFEEDSECECGEDI